jgi:hypothetical protein
MPKQAVFVRIYKMIKDIRINQQIMNFYLEKGRGHMKKAPLIVIVVLAALFAFSPAALADNLEVVISPQSVYVDGAQVAFEIYNINGKNYFKLRDLAYTLNGTKSQFSVDFDNTANMIALITGRTYRSIGNEMIIGADKMQTYINVADLCEYFGINVEVRIAYFEYQRCFILVIDH